MEVIVSTDPEVVLQKGERGVLPCRVSREVGTVTWSRGPELTTADILITLQLPHNGEFIKAGQGYEDKLYDIDDNFSLIINEARIYNNGNYFCDVLDLDSGRPITNNTNVIVFGEWIIRKPIKK